jgi:hypothetical protein
VLPRHSRPGRPPWRERRSSSRRVFPISLTIAAQAARDGTNLPPLYWTYFKTWIALGVPAFIAFVFIFWFMVSKPV